MEGKWKEIEPAGGLHKISTSQTTSKPAGSKLTLYRIDKLVQKRRKRYYCFKKHKLVKINRLYRSSIFCSIQAR